MEAPAMCIYRLTAARMGTLVGHHSASNATWLACVYRHGMAQPNVLRSTCGVMPSDRQRQLLTFICCSLQFQTMLVL